MAAQPRPTVRKPVFWLALCAGLLVFCVQSGELGSADTMHRLQTAHSFWTSQPAVFPNEYPEFGVHGRGGKLYDWYGIGQPLLLLPFDIVGTGISKLPILSDYGDNDPTVRNIFVTYSLNTLINVLTALVCYRFLLLLGFDEAEAIAGVLALLLCTTHLHYTQNLMENNYIMLLTMAGFCFQYEWLRTGSARALIIGSATLGLNLLTRLTTGLDLIAVAGFLVLVSRFQGTRKRECADKHVGAGAVARAVERSSTGRISRLQRRAFTYLKIALPIYAVFIFLDRLYQFNRFGNWTTTYVHYFTVEHRLQDPTLPAKYPWETPFHIGFLGPLISPEKSIFLFDPLIVLTIVIAAVAWKRLSSQVRAYVMTSLPLVLAYICLYARYTVWNGNFAWGDRYVSTAAEMAAFISVPLLLKFRTQLGRPVRVLGMFLIGASLLIQLASLAFWLPLEIYQIEDLGSQFVIWLRFKNIVAFALGKMDAWGLNTDAMTYDQWDYQHITCWNFLPFVLRRVGAAPRWVVDMAFGGWAAGIAALVYSLRELRSKISYGARRRVAGEQDLKDRRRTSTIVPPS
jgi:Dolichyl-phosphate-mannose-protein mannosyltransferase